MKCGSCRDTAARGYTQIDNDDEMFEILKTLNTRRAYNPKYSYFCGNCITQARARLYLGLSALNDQNALSFSDLSRNDSPIQSSESSQSVIGHRAASGNTAPVAKSKRPAESVGDTSRSKPCPKRFKKPLVPIQIADGTSSSQSHQKSVSSAPSAPSDHVSSEIVPEIDLLVDLESSSSQASNQSDRSESASVKGQQRKTNSLSSEDSPQNLRLSLSGANQSDASVHNPQTSEHDRSDETPQRQKRVTRASAPPSKTARPTNRPRPKTNSLSSEDSSQNVYVSPPGNQSDPSGNNPQTSEHDRSDETPQRQKRVTRASAPPSKTARPTNRPRRKTNSLSSEDSSQNVYVSPPGNQSDPSGHNPHDRSDDAISERTEKTTPRRQKENANTSAPPGGRPSTTPTTNPPQNPGASHSAPAVKNPRIRQPNSSRPQNLQSYFGNPSNAPVLSVNNYTRATSG